MLGLQFWMRTLFLLLNQYQYYLSQAPERQIWFCVMLIGLWVVFLINSDPFLKKKSLTDFQGILFHIFFDCWPIMHLTQLSL
jgi:hypothetical protein